MMKGSDILKDNKKERFAQDIADRISFLKQQNAENAQWSTSVRRVRLSDFALSRSCDLPRVCRICGAPALPKECNNGLICRECYNKHRREQQYHKRHEPTEREAKTCKYCGAPAMGGGHGAICRDCYNIRQNDRYPYIRTRKYEPCKICGTMTRSLAGICVRCQGKKMPKLNNSLEAEAALLELAKKYNAEHPLKAEEIKARWRAAYYG